MQDIRSRKFFCRIHKTNILENKKKHIYNALKVYNLLRDKYQNVVFCTHDKGTTNEHYHFIIQDENQIRKSTLLKIMPYGSIEKQNGSNIQVYEYMLHIDLKSRKNGKKEYTPDIITHNIVDFDTWLKLENEKGSRNDLIELDQLIETGATDYEIRNFNNKAYARYFNYIENTRKAINENKGSQERETMQVFYYYGDTGTGKTYTARHNHNTKDIFVVSDYRNPWDNYKGQPVLILEEYRSNFYPTELLQYLDVYPLELRARYKNNYACWTTIYLISNIPPQEQYPNVDLNTKKAFYRRINEIKHFSFENIDTYKLDLNCKPTNIQTDTNPISQLD